MKVKEPDFPAVRSLVWRQAPALLVFSFLANLLLVSPLYMLQVYDDFLPSGALDPLVWLTLATLVAIRHHHFCHRPVRNDPGF
jgi:ATP-binding cassette subfamily C exporter for protease/lipase